MSLLKIVFERSRLAVTETVSSSSGPVRARRARPRRGTPFRHRDNWLLPPAVLKAIRQAEAEDKIGIPADVESVVVVSRDVVESTMLDVSHVGAALRQIKVDNLGQLGCDRNFTVRLVEKGSIGLQRCLPTTPADETFWSQYKDRRGHVIRGVDGNPIMRRFVGSTAPIETPDITVVLRYRDHRLWVIAAYYGPASRKLPGTLDATDDDAKWWFDPVTGNGHALVVTQDMLGRFVKSSVTRECPW